MVKALREPTPKEVEAHESTHIPHEEWCETCMAGRGRNTPHRQRKSKWGKPSTEGWFCPWRRASRGAGVTHDESLEDEAPVKGPVPRVCIDYFTCPAVRWDMPCPPKSFRGG